MEKYITNYKYIFNNGHIKNLYLKIKVNNKKNDLITTVKYKILSK